MSQVCRILRVKAVKTFVFVYLKKRRVEHVPMVLMIGNLLHMFGHPDYKDGYMVRKGEGLGTFDYFNTLPYEGPPPLYQDDKPSVYNPKMDPLRALAGEWE